MIEYLSTFMHENPYTDPRVADEFDRRVAVDTAKQVIADDIIARIRSQCIILPLQADEIVIADLGCGPGQFIDRVRHAFPLAQLVYGDYSYPHALLSRDKVGQTKRRLPLQVNLMQGVPLQDSTVDAVVCNFVLSELPEIEIALDEYLRILKPGGLCAISMTSPLSDQILKTLRPDKIVDFDPFVQAAQSTKYVLAGNIRVPHYFRPIEELEQLFLSAGFCLTEEEIVRFYKCDTTSTAPLPLPEYLVFYLYKGENLVSYRAREKALVRSRARIGHELRMTEVVSREPVEKYLRVTS